MRRIDPCLTLPVKGWVAFELSIYRTGGRGGGYSKEVLVGCPSQFSKS